MHFKTQKQNISNFPFVFIRFPYAAVFHFMNYISFKKIIGFDPDRALFNRHIYAYKKKKMNNISIIILWAFLLPNDFGIPK